VIEFVGIQLAQGVAKQCYECAVLGCDDPFNAAAAGVTEQASLDGWCEVSILLACHSISVVELSYALFHCRKPKVKHRTNQL
jgi:hypothetical protein